MDWTGKIYPNTDPKGRRRIEKARRTNRARDEIERSSGHAPPSACPLDIELRTVLEALYCGLNGQDWVTVCEGIAMLQDAEFRVRKAMDGGLDGWMKLYSSVNERKIQ
jgi:hypothetical protein